MENTRLSAPSLETERDQTHGDMEVYDSQGRHLGSANPETGVMTKPAIPGRRIRL